MEDLSPQKSGLKWLFLDLNSYFASVEQQENPRLRGRPVAVVPAQTDYTCAIAASYEAKLYGVKTGTMIHEAKRLCPPLTCVLARHDVYVQYHHKIIDEVARHTPINKIWSIDELSSRLPPNKRNIESVTRIAQNIREGIWRNVGPAIHCSIGIAPNSFLAKVATDMMKPRGFVVLHPDDLPGPLLDLDLMDLPGINVAMLKRLNMAGIKSIADLWAISPKHARQIWGNVGGERFWYNLHGYDVPDIKTHSSMVGHSRILDPEHRKPDIARTVARRLTIKAASRLRRLDLFATKFSLSVRVVDGPRWGAEVHLPPMQDSFAILDAMENLWARMMDDVKPMRLQKASVILSGLKAEHDITLDLFEKPTPRNVRNAALSTLIDGINQRFGAESLSLGPSPKTRAGHLGTKIAFSRVPDMEEFKE